MAVGLFSEDGIAGYSTGNGLFYGGGFDLLGKQIIGIVAVGAFTFTTSLVIWFAIKKTFGLRVSVREEIEGLDIHEHGNQAYPEFPARKQSYTMLAKDIHSEEVKEPKGKVS
jgi:Amt family ammonium transporter